MTAKQAELVAFLRDHGPAKYDGHSGLVAGDESHHRMTYNWVVRAVEAGVVTRTVKPGRHGWDDEVLFSA
jgi:hypothetical protein